MEKEVNFKASTNKNTSKDKKLIRMIDMIAKLHRDERFTSRELESEYGVGLRCIQNDIKDLGLFFPLEKDKQKRYKLMDGVSLEKAYLNPDEMMLVSIALSQFKDVSDFDILTKSTLKKLLQPQLFNPYYIKFDDLEDIDIDSNLIVTIEEAIREKYHLYIYFNGNKLYVEPYVITNYEGIWYLLAKDETEDRIKNFMLNKISHVKKLSHKHKQSQAKIQKILSKINSAWFDERNSFDVKIKVNNTIAHYFKAKEYLQSQKILKEDHDGSLIISFEVSHYEDIDNIIKSWLPDIEVIEPLSYKEKIINELESYLKRIK